MNENGEKLNHIDQIRTSKKEEVELALRVDGSTSFMGLFDDDIFLLDYWHYTDGLAYLIGVSTIDTYWTDDGNNQEVTRISTLDHDFYLEDNQPHIVYAFEKLLTRLERIWNSGGHAQSNPPPYYIEWALSKNHKIPWLEYAIEKGFYRPKQSSKETKEELELSSHHVSNKLAVLKQAASKFWANADRTDRTTHPDNKVVKVWLIEKGFSETLADKAATIIRPEWAMTGRKPDK